MYNKEISEFGFLLLFIIFGVILVITGLTVSSFIRPFRPNDEKLSAYECGEEATGGGWGQVNLRFYLVALIFVLFEAEVVFLFPWAVVFGQKELIEITNNLWGWVSLGETFIFVFLLAIGLAYTWAKGYLDWVKPTIKKTDYQSPIPKKMYDKYKK
jgi:NADH-quinone oxidoreductase subunit A